MSSLHLRGQLGGNVSKSKIPFFFLILFLLFGSAVSWAAPATVTNNGNMTMRVQYKTPDGQYEDLGYVKPGETVNVPGGVEKVRIVRDPGRWAEPLKPGEVIDVVVKEGDKTTGTMTWYGDKVFFDGLSEGAPAVAVGVPTENQPIPKEEPVSPGPEPKTEPKPEITTPPTPTEKTEADKTPALPQSSNWPWYGGWWDSVFMLQLFFMWPVFLLLWWRNMRQTRFYLGERWVDESGAGWGWGWSDGGGCGRYGTLNGFFLGLALGTIALWGHSRFPDEPGFLPLFGQDLYAFPYFLLSLFHLTAGGFPDALFVILFWMIICTSCGALSGFIPLKGLYAAPFFMMILPFILLTRGCSCSHPFGCDGGYEGIPPYPPAFASFVFLLLLAAFFLDLADPYYESDGRGEAPNSSLGCLLFFVFLLGGCVPSVSGIAYEYGWDSAIAWYFHDTPLMLGLNFIPPVAMIALFWMLPAGVLGWSFYSHPMRFAFYSCFTLAFLALLFLTMGNYPQRHLDFYQEPLLYRHVQNILAPIVGEQVSGQPSESEDSFADSVGLRGLFRSLVSGRDIQVEETHRGDHQWQDDRRN